MARRDEVWTETEDFVRLFRTVSELLARLDPMGLTSSGAPAHEYDLEAGQIARLTLATARDRADTDGIVRGVFDAYFWPGDGAGLDLVGEQVWHAYERLRERRATKEPSRRAIGAEVLAYVRERLWLARGSESLLADRLRDGAWRAWTMADLDVPEDRLARFSEGGHVFSGGSVCDQVGRVAAGVIRRTDGWWIVPDPMANATDALMRAPLAAHVVVDGAVYYAEASSDPAQLAGAWRSAASAAGAVGLVAARGFGSSTPRVHELADIAATAELLVIEAYDGDGVVYVEPNP